ncbi:4Fe-4S dicluster domain-containing protein [uncultured Fibrella sp.]|uniref:4Fe-4S dicluster domain-containing protein n=1 Tax=uncultured Fibrella sp. TaxID=1284596 RepID=UPI0035CA64BD
MSYFSDISDGIRTTLKGLSLTVRHLRNATHRREPMGVADDNYFKLTDGLVTLQYPHEQLPIPDNGRYRLHNEIDDCIVCDKCAKVCPVDCITIDPIKATEEIGKASDGSPIRLYAAQFDIDMAKCCYCGLCTVVCPTECLTMEKKFDYSTFELGNLTYEFANLTPEQADEKRALYEQFVQEKEAAKRSKAEPGAGEVPAADQPVKPKPVFRPGMKAPAKPAPAEPATEPVNATPAKQPVPDESMTGNVPTDSNVPDPVVPATPPKPRPAFRPGMKPAPKADTPPAATGNSTEGNQLHPLTDPAPDEAEAIAMIGVAEQPNVTEPLTVAEKNAPDVEASQQPAPKKTAPFRPSMKPAAPVPVPPTPIIDETNVPEAASPKPKPAFRPSMKPATAKPADNIETTTTPTVSDAPVEQLTEKSLAPVKSKPAFRPSMKPAGAKPAAEDPSGTSPEASASETPVSLPEETPTIKPKPAFRPTMKPKSSD